jgi:hypothetical protein
MLITAHPVQFAARIRPPSGIFGMTSVSFARYPLRKDAVGTPPPAPGLLKSKSYVESSSRSMNLKGLTYKVLTRKELAAELCLLVLYNQ